MDDETEIENLKRAAPGGRGRPKTGNAVPGKVRQRCLRVEDAPEPRRHAIRDDRPFRPDDTVRRKPFVGAGCGGLPTPLSASDPSFACGR